MTAPAQPPGGVPALADNPDFIFNAPAAELSALALTTPIDPLFFLALDILRLRGEMAALAELRRNLDQEDEAIERRMAAARACGDARGAVDLIQAGGAFSLIPDVLMAAREADNPGPLLELCVRQGGLRSWYGAIAGFHALLDELTRSGSAERAAGLDILPWGREDLARSDAPRKPVRIAGILKVHNEGGRVLRTVRAMLAFCDDVVVWDHASDDGALDEVEAGLGADRARVEIHRSAAADFHEQTIYDGLFRFARARGATHLCHFDADEILETQFPVERLRHVAARLQPGEVASVQLLQLVGTEGAYLDYSRQTGLSVSHHFLPFWRDFLYADDGTSLHAPMALHVPWIPQEALRRRAFLDPAQIVNLHADKLDLAAAKVKNDWYKAKELVLHGFPFEKLLFRYLFYGLGFAFAEGHTSRRRPADTAMDAEIERRRDAEKRRDLRQWLPQIKLPHERWLFFFR